MFRVHRPRVTRIVLLARHPSRRRQLAHCAKCICENISRGRFFQRCSMVCSNVPRVNASGEDKPPSGFESTNVSSICECYQRSTNTGCSSLDGHQKYLCKCSHRPCDGRRKCPGAATAGLGRRKDIKRRVIHVLSVKVVRGGRLSGGGRGTHSRGGHACGVRLDHGASGPGAEEADARGWL